MTSSPSEEPRTMPPVSNPDTGASTETHDAALGVSTFPTDLEKGKHSAGAYLNNEDVNSLTWNAVTVLVKDRRTGNPTEILSAVNGHVEPGQFLALMGPSGCGKTTLLNVLAQRVPTAGAKITGEILIDGKILPRSSIRRVSSYVEQEDALIGSLTVRETLDFAARLSLPSSMPKKERVDRIQDLLTSFGLGEQADALIGTPIRKGISGGQKRRVSVASQVITGPKILFLDEPTSGLDSAASFEVISFIQNVTRVHNLIVVASIHQPSSSTFKLFDQLMLLSAGKTCYYGPASEAVAYFDSIGHPTPPQTNPAEFFLDLINVDFSGDQETVRGRLARLQSTWAESTSAQAVISHSHELASRHRAEVITNLELPRGSKLLIPMTLLHRSFIKSYRDVVAYGIRLAMYTGLAIMMGTVWLRLDTEQENIQPFINAIFFGSAFMSFMAVAYVPAFLEDRATYAKEHANGLYGPLAFSLANFLIGLPYLFLISLIFSLIAYWLSNFYPSGTAFFTWVMWLFLDLVAAESLVVLVSSLFPNFVIALAITAFANGLWMSVGGFLVPPKILNVFWRYVFHYVDYQASTPQRSRHFRVQPLTFTGQTYVFQGMMVNEFTRRTYTCGDGCHCLYQTSLASKCRIDGTGVLAAYGYSTTSNGLWVGILIAIIAGYRILGWAALALRRS